MSDDEALNELSPEADGAEHRQRRTRWLFWLQWVLVNAVGWAFLVGVQRQSRGGPVAGAMIVLGAACMVLAQWLILRPRLARAGWWLLVTPVGLGLGGFAFPFAIYVAGAYFGQRGVVLGLLATLLVGTPVGFLQWLVLRRQARRALWWLPVTVGAVGAGLLGLWLCLMVFAELPAALAGFVLGAASGFVLGAVYGAITGAALAVLLPHPPQTRDRKPSPSRLVVGIALLSVLAICLGWGSLVEPQNARHMLIQYRLGRLDFGGIRLEGADLSGANLTDAWLSGAGLSGANLTDANLTDARLGSADLTNANLTAADLTDAWLDDADLTNANLSRADLKGAHLGSANLTHADLSAADLSGALLSGATVTGAQLARVHMYTPAILPDGTEQKEVAAFPPAAPTPAPPVLDAMRQLEPGWTSYLTGTEVTDYFSPGGTLVGSPWSGIGVAADGALWFTTLGAGVFRFDGATWTRYSEEDGLCDDVVLSVTAGRGPLEGTGDMLWFATAEGICRFDGKSWTSYPESAHLAGGPGVTALGPDGALWYGTAKGATRFDGENWTTYTTADPLIADYILDIAVGSDGALWIATNDGVSRYERGLWDPFHMGHGLADNRVASIAVAPDGALWFGTERGVSRFDGEKRMTTYTSADGLVNDAVDAVAVAAGGVPWFGTRGGVSRFDGLTWTSYTTGDGLAHDTVSVVEIAPDGAVWFGTEGGLSRYVPPGSQP